MSLAQISFEEGERHITWSGLCDAIEQGHRLPRAHVDDTFLYRGRDTLLSRSAWIDGLGLAVKSATVFPDNPDQGRPMINGAVTVFDDASGVAEAMIDFHLVTKWKTAGDSLLAAKKLARPDSKTILVVGAGTVGKSLISAYRSLFQNAQFFVWNRTAERGQAFAQECGATFVEDLETAVKSADIVTCATMSTEPVLKGAWLRPGQHIDLIGAYRPDMREADDEALQKARIFVDSRDTTMGHIGELKIPLEQGRIQASDVIADYYEMEKFARVSEDEITLFKNGGGAHMDLMTSRYILSSWRDAQ